MADGSIRVETKLDTQGIEKGLEDVDKMCDSTKKHIEDMAEQLSIKTNPIEIVNETDLVKTKKRLAEITEQIEKVQAETDKMCGDATLCIENLAKSLNIKTNPILLVDEDVLKSAEKEIDKISKKIKKLKADDTEEIYSINADKKITHGEVEQKTFKILSQERKTIAELKERQKNLVEAVEEYRVKQIEITQAKKEQIELEKQSQTEAKAAEKQQKGDIKGINADVSGSTQASDFISKIKDADDYERKLQQVSARIQEIEQKTAKAAAKKGIDGSEALKANKEYQKLTKRYDELVKNADKFKKSSKGGFGAAKEGAKGLGSSMKSAIKTMTKYTLAIFGARSGFYAIKNAIKQVLSDNEELNNTVTAMKGAFANALAPVIEKVVNWIKYAFAYLNLFVKTLTGVDMAAQYNAKAIDKQTKATEKNAKATKKANQQLASFDEKNVQSKNDDTDKAALLNLPDVSGGKFEEICETIKKHLADIEAFMGGVLIAVGLVLLVCGQTPLGIAAIIAGIALEAVAIGNADEMENSTKTLVNTIMLIAGGALLAIGIMLCTAGQIPMGIAVIAIGVALIVAAIAMEVNEMPDEVKNMLIKIMGIAGAALLALGVILILAAGRVPLGMALIAAGTALLVTSIALAVDQMPSEVRNFLQIVFAIVSVALLVLGIILLCTGVHLMLGVALVAAGAALLVTTIALNWNKLSEDTKKTISVIAGIVSVALLVLGIILLCCGVTLPLGIALVAAGAVGLVTSLALNRDAVKNLVASMWQSVKNFWNSHIAPVFTKKWWTDKLSPIANGMKDTINSVIGIVEKGINWIVSKLNLLSFDIPDWVPGVGGKKFGFNLPYVSLPRLAKGGIVNNPGKGRAVIAGEAGAEAVLPLQNNTEWMDLLVDKVADKVSMTVLNRIYLDSKEIHSSSRKYGSRFDFATNGGVL